tara:strand:+ start:151 stop:456 length:306 start_codon:yes stop_codon:yes gene_type:complete
MDMDTPCCTSCGSSNGEYTVINYKKVCKLCSGILLSVNEMIDIINDLQIQGLLPEKFLDYRTEQVYSREELDFDDDLLSVENAIAREDAMRDMVDLDGEEY